MRIGTWNLAGRWSLDHERLMTAQACDLWLLTEVSDRVELPGMQHHFGREHMAARRHWAAIVSHHRFEPLEDPHPASASVQSGNTTFVSSVLPWRSCGARHPWIGSRHEEKTQAAVGSVVKSLQGPVVWGGDWNHALHGPEYAGSRAGRRHIENAVDQLELQVPTERLPHRIDGLLSIDHIAVPTRVHVLAAERVSAATDERRLSDHDAYVLTLQD
ncbi:endonuclease/exonuclease/phosphatase family protein [Pedococcus sp. NPDC057267]|uniref:endonuclease/exonuclease/phosphatase family protein n=1 Tax=Pedococcus sp. NPDC057267 TaxID=3346077 RepID=UPI0036325AE9